jgi:DNA polymerase III epsilon subunit-like protein
MAILDWLFGRTKRDDVKIEPALKSDPSASVLRPTSAIEKSPILPEVRPIDPAAIPPAALREVVFDCETTGFRARAGDRIVALSFVEVLDRRVTGARLDLMVNPAQDPGRCARGARHHRRRCPECPSFAAVAPRILEFVRGCPLVGYNVGFDLDFLSGEFVRAGIDPGTAIGDWSASISWQWRRAAVAFVSPFSMHLA